MHDPSGHTEEKREERRGETERRDSHEIDSHRRRGPATKMSGHDVPVVSVRQQCIVSITSPQRHEIGVTEGHIRCSPLRMLPSDICRSQTESPLWYPGTVSSTIYACTITMNLILRQLAFASCVCFPHICMIIDMTIGIIIYYISTLKD